MVKRLLDCNASDFAAMEAQDLAESIRLSEGRVVAAEILATAPPLIDKVSNAELAAGMGADLILFNLYDVEAPQITGFPDREGPEAEGFGHIPMGRGVTLADARAWLGRPVGLNLEPVPDPERMAQKGRLASARNARAAVEQGASFLLLTANPKTGVTTQGLSHAVGEIRDAVGDAVLLIAGKMHAAGRMEPVVTAADVHAFADAGADGVVLPAPGTVPGMTLDLARALVETARGHDLLVMNTVGTSQEGASVSVIEQLALMSKMAGADIHHLGDTGTFGMAVPENIVAWSLALRGRRHTWHRMAASLKR